MAEKKETQYAVVRLRLIGKVQYFDKITNWYDARATARIEKARLDAIARRRKDSPFRYRVVPMQRGSHA